MVITQSQNTLIIERNLSTNLSINLPRKIDNAQP